MTSQLAPVSGFDLSKFASLSLNDTVARARNSGTLLENTLELLEPSQVTKDETAQNAYKECLQLKTYITEQLHSGINTDDANDIQNALDILTRAIVSFEMMKDAADGDWDTVDVDFPSL
ncbi:hypothetical protein BC941DRAFT_411731 [Chlamydoabsidia padenii]|nr:hypothetical protein BC941DRAFT_411731 [Chlamydoabsidia padenii]